MLEVSFSGKRPLQGVHLYALSLVSPHGRPQLLKDPEAITLLVLFAIVTFVGIEKRTTDGETNIWGGKVRSRCDDDTHWSGWSYVQRAGRRPQPQRIWES